MNEQAKHTPGPWKVEFDEDGGYDMQLAGYMVLAPDIYREICTVEVQRWRIDSKPTWKKMHSRNAGAEADANLIAAAPDLLDVCAELLACCEALDEADCPTRLLARARAAIAKARGQQ